MPTILVVGDFPTTSLTGHKVLTASGYDEGTEMLKAEDFGLIIMDAVIGTTDGRGFLTHIRDHKPTPTIVRYQEDTFHLPAEGRDWIIPNFVKALYAFVILVCAKDNQERIGCKAYELLQPHAA